MLRILVADEHDIVRHGVRLQLEAQGFTVVAEAADGKEAILNAFKTKPDVVVLAYELPIANGLEATSKIKAFLPKTEVLIYTSFNIENVMGQLVDAGARGCVLKSEPMKSLAEGVRSVASHKPYFAGIFSPLDVPRGALCSGTLLTNREQNVVSLIAGGESNKRIAQKLGISLKTVETHRANAMRKLELESAAQLVRYAVRNGLVMA